MLLQNGVIFYKGNFLKMDMRTESHQIVEIAPHISGKDRIDCSEKLIIPGLIDLHTHGCVGYDFSTSSPKEINQMLEYYQTCGITSVCATTMTMSPQNCKEAAKNIAIAAKNSPASRIIGINMEGPFLNPQKKGAHDETLLLSPDATLIEETNQLSDGLLRIMDIAPELPGAMDIIKKYSKEKIISLAHTSSNYSMALEAFEHGANHITHLFNAMNGLHHRDPGLVGALYEKDFFAEVICDGTHIHPTVIRMIFELCAPKLVLISDSMCACGLSDGDYQLGGLDVTVCGQTATLADGTIAGSVTNVYQGMLNAIKFGIKPEQAVLSATLLPAQSIRCDHQYGSLEVGKTADFLILDKDYKLLSVFQDGRLVHSA